MEPYEGKYQGGSYSPGQIKATQSVYTRRRKESVIWNPSVFVTKMTTNPEIQREYQSIYNMIDPTVTTFWTSI